MVKIPTILEAGRADGILIKTNNVYDDNQEKFLSDKLEEIDNNHNTLNNVVNSLADEEDITKNTDGKLQFKNKEYGDGMGYVILRKNKSFAEQVTKENTIYEIRYDFDLNSEEITIPKGCVLDFKGGGLSNGNIIGKDFDIKALPKKIFDLSIEVNGYSGWFYPEWYGAKGDGVIDDTIALQKLNGKHIFLIGKTYLASNLIYNSYTHIRGLENFQSCLKQKDGSTGDFIRFVDWFAGSLEDVRIEGGSNIQKDNTLFMQALVKIVNYTYKHNPDASGNWDETDTSTYYSRINNVVIRHSKYSGLSVLGIGHNDAGQESTYNWIHRISNLWITWCDDYGIYDSATDNLWNNINVSHCGLANMYVSGSAEFFNNLKLDGESGYAYDNKSMTSSEILRERYGGCLLTLIGSGNSFINLDCQSCLYAGIKIDGNNNIIKGSVNNIGIKYPDSLSDQNNCPAIYFYNWKGGKGNNIDITVFQIDEIKGSCPIKTYDSNDTIANIIKVNFIPYNNNFSSSSYNEYLNTLYLLEASRNTIIKPRGSETLARFFVAYYKTGYAFLCPFSKWDIVNAKGDLIPLGLYIVDGDSQFVLGLNNVGVFKMSADNSIPVYGSTDTESDEGYINTYANNLKSDLAADSAYKQCASYKLNQDDPLKWYIPSIKQWHIILKYEKEINKILQKLGGTAIVYGQFDGFWTSNKHNDFTHYYIRLYDRFHYTGNLTSDCHVRPVANLVNNNFIPYKSGTTIIRNSIVNIPKGWSFFDYDLGKNVWYNGTAWVDATGANI